MKRLHLLDSASVIALVVIGFLAVTIGPIRALAEGSADYREMGSVAGIAAACYGSQLIPKGMNAFISEIAASSATAGGKAKGPDLLKSYISDYKDAYTYALTHRTVWDGKARAYDKTAFDCENRSDMKMIRKWEQQMYGDLMAHISTLADIRRRMPPAVGK